MLEPGDPLGALIDPALEPLFQRPTRLGPDSAWYGHLPFAGWIMRAACPSVFVELGTHAGISYAGFCEAVLSCHLPTRCVAIDSWQGDEHAGFYSETVYEEFSRFHDQRFGGFSRLLRCRFEQALERFPDAAAGGASDGGIDLLHIDGRHLLSDITEDFQSWLPKLSARAVVLLHDTNVRERDFGVWRFWETLRGSYPSFEFLHAHGLGVLAVGAEAPDPVLRLCRLGGEAAGLLRERFALAGERWEKEYALTLRDRHLAHLLAEQADAGALRTHVEDLAGEKVELSSKLLQADAFLRAQAVELGLARSALADARAAHHASTRQGSALARLAESEAEAARVLEAERDQARAALRAQAQQAREQVRDLQAGYEQRLRDGEAALALRTHEMALLRGSFFWRLTAPLRGVLDALRPARDRLTGADEAAAPPPPVEISADAPVDVPVDTPTGPENDAMRMPVDAVTLPAAAPLPALRPADRRELRRILFVVGEVGTPGATYRCLRNAAACRAAGYEAETVGLFDVNPDNLAQADLLVLWRAPMSQHVETMIRLARKAGTWVAFDIDDLMTRPELARIDVIDGIRTIGSNEAETRAYFTTMLQTMQAADLCIATTEELAEQMRRQRDVVHVLPNTYDAATLDRARYARRRRQVGGDDGRVRLGYAGGTRTHQKDFTRAAPALARVLRARPETLLVLFREPDNHRSLLQMEEFPELADLAAQIEWRDMVELPALPDELARLDVSLCPLEDGNPFCEAKSELKYFEAALAGVCTVASPTGPYRRAIREGVTGFLAADPAQWEHVLLQLIDQPTLREHVGRDAYHDVLWRFGPRRQSELVATLLGGLDPASAGDADSSPAAARCVELELRRGGYAGRSLPEVPDSELLFSHDRLGSAEVTVVMTSYNYEWHILEALDSVRAQTLEVIDLAVVDDGSTDQSVPLVIEWAKRHQDRFNRIRILRTRHNAGLGGARNVVFDAAETPWLMALDSDNRLLPEACATLLEALHQVPQAAFAYPRIRQFGGAELVMGEAAFEPSRLRGGNYIDAMAMVAKWAWAAAGGYYVRRDAMGWEDFDLWLNLVELGQFGIATPEILAEYRVHPRSMVNAITEQSDNKRAMVQLVEQRHPWLRLRTRDAKRRA